MTSNPQELTQQVRAAGNWVAPLQQELAKVVVGQSYLVNGLLIGLLTNGHVLLEGYPDSQRRSLSARSQPAFKRGFNASSSLRIFFRQT